MADNLTTQSGTLASVPAATAIATDDVGGVHFQKVKIDIGGDGLSVILSNANPLPVGDAGGSLTVDGTIAATQSGNWSVRNQDGAGNNLASSTSAPAGTEQALIVRNIPSGTQTVSGTVTANAGTGPFPVSDNNGSLTVDAPVGTPVFVRLSDGSSAIATLPVSATQLPAALSGSGNLRVAVVEDTVGSLTETEDGSIAPGQSNVAVTIPLGSYYYNGTNWVRPSQIRFASISASSSGDNSIVAAVVGQRIQVMGYVLTAAGAVNVRWRRATTDMSGLIYLDAAGSGVAVGFGNTPLLETGVNEALQLNLSAAVAVGGHVAYREVP